MTLKRSRWFSKDREAMIAGTVQPNPKIMGINARPESPSLLIIPSMTYATGHISAVLQKGQRQKQNENVWQESQDATHTGDDAIYQQRAQHFIDSGRNQSIAYQCR